MKKIKLTQGKETIVDDNDFELLNKYKWYAHEVKVKLTGEIKYYARRHYMENGVKKSVYMHRQILNLTDKNIVTDHKDQNSLNNQRNNLRLADKRQNAVNTKSMRGASKYIGVSIYRTTSRKGIIKNQWKVQIEIAKDKRKHLAYLDYTPANEVLAAKLYDLNAKKYYGEFASLNFK